jgi:hypothetical protein
MRSTTFILAVLLFASPAWAKYDPIMQAPEIPEGWSPAQAADWQGAKIQYAEAKDKFGAESPQAARAKLHLNVLAQRLDAYADRPLLPVEMNPGSNGTYAPASEFDQKIDPVQ